MTEIDPLIRLLQTADAAADLPKATGDLPDRVRRLRARRARKSKQIRFAGLAVSAVVLVGISIYALHSPAPPGGEVPIEQQIAINPPHPKGTRPGANGHNVDIARLRADADALAAEAAALEHELALTRGYEVRQQLREEHQSQLAAQLKRQSSLGSLDRAALVGISQGDFYRDVRQSTDEARAAYESVIDYFPDSHWAAIAQGRIRELQMN